VGKTIVSIACGALHTIALDSTGSIHAWGYNGNGGLGDNTFVDKKLPIAIMSVVGSSLVGKNIVSIACGYQHTIALDSTGSIHACGYNNNGQVGDNTTVDKQLPVAISYTGYSATNMFINFTGQHRCFVNGIAPKDLLKYQGLIVVTDNNKYITNFTCGTQAISINDALPVVSISSKPSDKRVFGVISLQREDPAPLTIDELINLQNIGDTRAEINAVGEGGIWVCDQAGALEAGDYMVTSSVPGYAMKQSDDFQHAYTVAKLTIDCDFSCPLQDSRVIRVDEYRNRILDSFGNPIWDIVMQTTTTTTDVDGKSIVVPLDPPVPMQEPIYVMRYLLSDATQITLEEYNTRLANSEPVYKAAFIGCTYHCG
jgi:hypothetical protein